MISNKIIQTTPAKQWEESTPVGNGACAVAFPKTQKAFTFRDDAGAAYTAQNGQLSVTAPCHLIAI